MEQCLHCRNRLFFEPLPDETFTCCWAHGETVTDIDLETGVSPAIEEYGLKNVPCDKFWGGKSICLQAHPVREDGERFLRAALGLTNRAVN